MIEMTPEQVRELATTILNDAIAALARAGIAPADIPTILVGYGAFAEIALDGEESAIRLLESAKEHLLAMAEAEDPKTVKH